MKEHKGLGKSDKDGGGMKWKHVFTKRIEP